MGGESAAGGDREEANVPHFTAKPFYAVANTPGSFLRAA